MTIRIDLNCDMGESFGRWAMGNDRAIMPFISSANIACGFHAGDPGTISKTIDLALEHGVAIGAHPSYPDLQGFGRRDMALTPDEVYEAVLYQVAAIKGVCEAKGGKLHHVKPHGALYNRSASDKLTAKAIAEAVRNIDSNLLLYGLSGSVSITEAALAGLKTANEVFSDRTYQTDCSLTPRSEENSMITTTQAAVDQITGIIKNGSVVSTSGESVMLNAETVCIHGDGENAHEFAKAIRESLEANGIVIEAV